MKNPRFIESGRTAGNRLPSPGKVKKAVSKPATDLENRSPPFRVKKGVGALRHKPYYSSNSVSSPPQGKEQSTHEQDLLYYRPRKQLLQVSKGEPSSANVEASGPSPAVRPGKCITRAKAEVAEEGKEVEAEAELA
ncbi:hypothetical protein QYF36_013789 [Acer negundo]|nr:hypothetical protein QYF36_021141 [Acer negundo]KAK4838446.1 hypothetical protein QYF36_013789 [Acer negundo]